MLLLLLLDDDGDDDDGTAFLEHGAGEKAPRLAILPNNSRRARSIQDFMIVML